MNHITNEDFEIQFNNLIYYGEYRVSTFNHWYTSATYLQPAEYDCDFEVTIEKIEVYDTISEDIVTDPNANQNESEVMRELNDYVNDNLGEFIN